MSSHLDVSCSPLAVLTSVSGTMCIYSEVAFKIWIDSELASKLNALRPVVAQRDTCQPADKSCQLVGFSIEDLIKYAKKKASIASSIAIERGKLRAKVSVLEKELEALKSTSTSSAAEAPRVDRVQGVDPLCVRDPWSSCSSYGSDVRVSGDTSSLWSKYRSRLATSSGNIVGLSLTSPPCTDRSDHPNGDLPLGGTNDVLVDSDETPVKGLLASPSCEHGAVSTHGATSKSKELGLKGDWRSLPKDAFHVLIGRFPKHPFRTDPESYIAERWPSYGVLLNAARHWRRYGYTATLPADIYDKVDHAGCNTELQALKDLFKNALAARADRWRDKY